MAGFVNGRDVQRSREMVSNEILVRMPKNIPVAGVFFARLPETEELSPSSSEDAVVEESKAVDHASPSELHGRRSGYGRPLPATLNR
ncbi:UNVERIFIED_ORG: hypothetical protein GGI57_006411 [Rhizobium aethiopicum]|nr:MULTISPECIES: hypothetical protein [Rhizobium]UWU39018.1 hypothetical protein N2597_33400 [Rhizobium leguminosarum bv. phaseoli]MBB4420729.1 hypothetical protein [Rhizobium leguminosarum]MDK4730415.1 hypothetical protein [Rhizobium phaseoli]NKE92099.1 hypothetical protein [Rhizobium phaseoli]ULR42443.1 hypothetical protein MHI61_03915 [Rhizobium sp. K102]